MSLGSALQHDVPKWAFRSALVGALLLIAWLVEKGWDAETDRAAEMRAAVATNTNAVVGLTVAMKNHTEAIAGLEDELKTTTKGLAEAERAITDIRAELRWRFDRFQGDGPP